jgi:hypothetical protein
MADNSAPAQRFQVRKAAAVPEGHLAAGYPDRQISDAEPAACRQQMLHHPDPHLSSSQAGRVPERNRVRDVRS